MCTYTIFLGLFHTLNILAFFCLVCLFLLDWTGTKLFPCLSMFDYYLISVLVVLMHFSTEDLKPTAGRNAYAHDRSSCRQSNRRPHLETENSDRQPKHVHPPSLPMLAGKGTSWTAGSRLMMYGGSLRA